MTPATRIRIYWLAGGLAIAAGLAAGARFWLGGYIVRSVLGLAGASHIRFAEVSGTPWRLEVRELAFDVRLQGFSARRVVLERDEWWQASLGDVRVEQARAVFVLDGSDADPWRWSTYETGGLGEESVQLPFRSLHLDGELVVRMSSVPDVPLAVTLQGRPAGPASWTGSLEASGPGFELAGRGSLVRAGQQLDFAVHRAYLDLAQWSHQIQRLVALPGAPWALGGRLTGTGEGTVTARRFAATARVSLRDGHMRAGTQEVAATGVSADLEFSDLWKLRTRTGVLRIAILRAGRLTMTDVASDFGLWNGRQVSLHDATLNALGGSIAVDPFAFQLDDRVAFLTLRPAGLSVASLLALTHGPVPRLGGRAHGVLPLRLQDTGVLLQPGGYLALEAESAPELQLSAAQFVRSGAVLSEETEAVFKGLEGQSVIVRLGTFRLDVRPSDLPLGASARVVAAGRVDGRPVSFSYLVNGAIERHLRIMP